MTRLGKIERRVPQDRQGRFSTELFARYQRSDKGLLAALAEMAVQGVSTRKVRALTEERVGHSFSAASIAAIVNKLAGELSCFARRRLTAPFPSLILAARYEKVRLDHVIHSQAGLIAGGIDGEGRRQILGVELSHRESRSRGRDFLSGKILDLRFQALPDEITACHSSLGGDPRARPGGGEGIDVVKDASTGPSPWIARAGAAGAIARCLQRAFVRTPYGILDTIESTSPIMPAIE